MKEHLDTENVLFVIFVAVLLSITGAMGWVVYRIPPKDPAKTIKILIPADTQYVDRQARLTEAYRKLHPDADIEPIRFPWDNIWQKLEYMIVANIPPDISGMQQPNLPKFVSTGEVEPLDKWIESDPSFSMDAIYKEVLDEGNWDNKQWSLPESFSTTCLWYNKNLFDEAGLAYPTADWTQEDLVANAKKLTRDINGDGVPDYWGFFTDNNHWNRYPSFIWQRGGDFNTPDMTRSTFDSPITIEGMRWLANLSLKDRVMPTTTVMGTTNVANLFISGHLAMTIQTRYFLSSFFQGKNVSKVKSFDWDVCELPHEKFRATTLILDLDIIPSTVPPERKRMAWEYMKFLVSGTGQQIIADDNTALPVIKELAEKTVVHPGRQPAHDHAFLDCVSYARYFYHPFPADEAFMDGRSDLQGVWNGDLDVAEVCQKITLSMNKAVDDYLRANPDAHLPVKTKWVPPSQRSANMQSTAAQ